MPTAFTFRKGFSGDLIVGKIQDSRLFQEDGTIAADSAKLADWDIILHTAMVPPSSASRERFSRALQRAIFSKALGRTFSKAEFEAECKRQYENDKPERLISFQVIFEMTLKDSPLIRIDNAADCRLLFSASRNSRFLSRALKERAALIRRSHVSEYAAPRQPLMPVIATVQAVRPWQAHTVALERLDEIRGLANFVLNLPRYSQITFGPSKPINNIRFGSIQSIHNMDGSLAVDGHWYERDWTEPPLVSFNASEALHGHFKRARRKLASGHGLTTAARAALRQYARALDNRDWKDAFLELWVALEYLTAISNADYDRLVKRLAALWRENDEITQIAQHLRLRRNEIVHESSDDLAAEKLIFQAKRLFEPLMWFYINNSFSLSNREEVGQFLDLPNAMDGLVRRQHLVNSALYFRRER